jgi:hypothetical protein
VRVLALLAVQENVQPNVLSQHLPLTQALYCPNWL